MFSCGVLCLWVCLHVRSCFSEGLRSSSCDVFSPLWSYFDVFFLWGWLFVFLSSCKLNYIYEVFLLYDKIHCLPANSSSCEVIFLWVGIPLWPYSFEAIFLWISLPENSFSVLVYTLYAWKIPQIVVHQSFFTKIF